MSSFALCAAACTLVQMHVFWGGLYARRFFSCAYVVVLMPSCRSLDVDSGLSLAPDCRTERSVYKNEQIIAYHTPQVLA